MKNICIVDGCERKHNSKGYCAKHYTRYKRYGDPLYTKRVHDHPEICTMDECNNKYYAKGYCHKHYARLKKHGDPCITELEYHGMRATSEYSTWRGMKKRCNDINNKSYDSYGGRGITVCDRWQNSFLSFYEDMGKRPFLEAELDRKENDGNYEPGNCRWVTKTVNANNKRNTKKNKTI